MRRRYWVLIAVLAAGAAMAASLAFAASRPQSTTAATPTAPAWLTKAALNAAADYGDTEPLSLSWALTDRGRADALQEEEATPKAGVEGSRSCYVVVLTGDFTLSGARRIGDRQLQGNTIELVYDPVTHERTDLAFFEGDGTLDTSAVTGLATVDLTSGQATDR